jgi:hypothetical protein
LFLIPSTADLRKWRQNREKIINWRYEQHKKKILISTINSMTVKLTVINNKNQYLKHKDNNLQIPIALLNLILRMKIEWEMMKSSVYANYSPQKKSERAHVWYFRNGYNVTNTNTGFIWSTLLKNVWSGKEMYFLCPYCKSD